MARTAAFCTALRCYSCRLGPLTSRRPGHTKVSEATVTPVEADSQPSPLVHKAKRHPLHEPSYAAFGQSFSGSKNGEVLEIPVGTDAGCCEMVSRHESTGTAIGSGSVHACLRYESICQPNRVNRGYRSGQARILPSLTFLESLMGILPLRFRKCRRTSTLFLSIADAAAVHLCHSQRISARNQWTKDGALYNSVSQPLLCPVSSYACATTTKTWPLLHARTFSSQMNSSATYCSFLAHVKSSASVQYVHSSSDVAHCF